MTLNKDIDQVFREGLEGHSEKPPGFIWDNIEQNLNQVRLKKRRNIVYSIAASLALLISFGAGYMLTNVQTNVVAVNANNVVFDGDETQEVKNMGVNSMGQQDLDNKQKDYQPSNTIQQTIETKEEVKPSETNQNGTTKPKNTQPADIKEKKDKNIKKVNSGGTLLPPMYASNNKTLPNENNNSLEEENEADQNTFADNELTAINRLNLKNIDLPNVEQNKQLAYDDRLLFNPYDYALAAPETKNDFSSWSVGVAAAPLVSYRDVVSVSSDAVYSADNNASYSENYDNEKPLTSYSAGINVGYKVSKRLKIQSGVYYSEMGQISENIQINPDPVYSSVEENTYSINTSVGNIAVKNSENQLYFMVGEQDQLAERVDQTPAESFNVVQPLNADFVQTYDFYEIPVVVNYTVVDKKFAMNVSGGLSANILNSNKTYVKNNDERLELDANAESINNFTYSGIVGLGFEYPIVEKLLVNLQPTFRYSLNSINNAGSVYPYSFGIYTGLRYNF